ncbi:hypothetical protein [Dokdonella soli]|uniref:DUF4402 domain-containing protein n=1 Tax=Dokdonella soli TaxID=529810 RepID=A0ABP3TLR4_9GAMM
MRARSVSSFLAGLCLLGSLLPAGAAPAPQVTGPVAFGGGASQLTVVAGNVSVMPIRLDDIADLAVQPLAADQRRTLAAGGQLVSPGAISLPPVRLLVTRELRQVWRMQQPVGRSLVDIGVRARVESVAGPDALASEDRPGERLPVRVISRAPRTVSADSRSQTLEGDVLLEFNLRDLRVGGRYTGRLVISAEGT